MRFCLQDINGGACARIMAYVSLSPLQLRCGSSIGHSASANRVHSLVASANRQPLAFSAFLLTPSTLLPLRGGLPMPTPLHPLAPLTPSVSPPPQSALMPPPTPQSQYPIRRESRLRRLTG